MSAAKQEAILTVRRLQVYFPVRKGVMKRVVGHVHAVEDVSFDIRPHEVFALVGESGCGKSTTGNAILRLIEPTGGTVCFKGQELGTLSEHELRLKRRDMQFIFQNPYSSLNPRMNVWQLLSEPLRLHFDLKGTELKERVEDMLRSVGMTPDQLERYPHQFSGGQKQRISIARALITHPSFVVADEPVSALDVSIQAQILNLLQDLQEQQGLTYMFITHDLSVVKHISDEILVMYVGCMVEKCEARELFQRPLHPYTKGLLSAIPVPNVRRKRERILLQGELTSPIDPKPGCRFAPRCPYADEQCCSVQPQYTEVLPGHFVTCHHVKKINAL